MSWWGSVLLGVFLFLYGIFAVTNFEVVWGRPLMGFAALVAGIYFLFIGPRSPYR